MGEGRLAARQVTAASPVPARGPSASPPTPGLASTAPLRLPAARPDLTTGSQPDAPMRRPLGAAAGPRPRPRTRVRAESRRSRAYPLACSVSSSLSPSIPHVSWSSSSRLCWLAADSLSSAIAAARAAAATPGAASEGAGAAARAAPSTAARRLLRARARGARPAPRNLGPPTALGGGARGLRTARRRREEGRRGPV